jgi:hypothetical protein
MIRMPWRGQFTAKAQASGPPGPRPNFRAWVAGRRENAGRGAQGAGQVGCTCYTRRIPTDHRLLRRGLIPNRCAP